MGLLGLVFVVAVVVAQNPVNFGGNTFQAVKGGNGNPGGFKTISTNGNWMSLQIDSLCEYNGDTAVQCADLKKHSFGWGTDVIVGNVPQIDGNTSNDNFQQNSVTVQLDNAAIFSITAYLLNADAKGSDGKKGQVKWTYTIQNWPWTSGQSPRSCNEIGECTGGGQLCLLAGLDGYGSLVNGGASHAKKGNGTAPAGYTFQVQGVTYQNGFLNQPSQALCDGAVIDISCGHTLKGAGKPEAQWCFPYCAGKIVYDPVTGAGGTGGGNVGNQKTSNPGTVQSQTGNLQANKDGSFGVSSNGNWAGLQWADLTEYAPDGTVVQSVSLAKNDYGWSQPDLYTVIYAATTTVSEKMPHVNFTSTLVNGATFTVDCYFFNVSSVVSSNKRNSIKFTVTIQNWPWASTVYCEAEGFCKGGTLVLTAGLVGYGGIVRHYIHSGGANYGDLVQADFTFATLVSPNQAVYDPDTTAITQPVGVTYSLTGKPIVQWTFNYFQQKNCL